MNSKQQLAVYNGRETSRTDCYSSGNRVYFYPTEYLTYGYGSSALLTTRPNGNQEYKVTDHLGSTRVVVDSTGYILSQYDYEPFGKPLAKTGLDSRKSFIDKEKDYESGLGDFGVRKFDDGRFTSIDPLWEKYKGWNPYQYSGNNPLRLIDPSGLEWFDIDGTGDWTYKKDTKSMSVTRKDKEGNDVIVEQAGIKQLLSFDGKSLNIHTADGKVLSFQAESGILNSEGETQADKQGEKGGPIPEGAYYIDLSNVTKFDDLSLSRQILSTFGLQSPSGGKASWGEMFTPILPRENLESGRGGFYIHGGNTPGSAGCIDLCHREQSFFLGLGGVVQSNTTTVPLFVNYPKK
ncbi:MAG: hypothetical protein JST20_12850 [Bacteroidetes bacterium]|nr:hypothetical protein [Bacteroidota bacterium]